MTRTRIALLALVAAATLLLSGCIGPFQTYGPMSKSIDLIYHIEFSQSQSVPDFDTSEYVIDGIPEIEPFQQILRDHDVEPWNYSAPDTAGCTGGITTTMRILYHGAGTTDLVIDGCDADEGTFEADATGYFTDWRLAHAEPAPASDITGLTFHQEQAVDGFDTAVYVQDDPAELARLVDLLQSFDVVPGQYSIENPPQPCPGSIATEATLDYGTQPLQPVLLIDSCTPDDGFSAAATDLFTEWREAA